MECLNAIISKAFFGFEEDHGFFGWYIQFTGDGWGQGTGFYSDIELMKKILKTLEINSWSDLRGEKVRIKRNMGGVYEIGHIINNKWVIIKEVI